MVAKSTGGISKNVYRHVSQQYMQAWLFHNKEKQQKIYFISFLRLVCNKTYNRFWRKKKFNAYTYWKSNFKLTLHLKEAILIDFYILIN